MHGSQFRVPKYRQAKLGQDNSHGFVPHGGGRYAEETSSTRIAGVDLDVQISRA